MRTRPAVALLLAAFALAPAVLATPEAQDDAGTGGDAPNAWETAVDLALGSHPGELAVALGDGADWYRVAAPADKDLRLVVRAPLSGLNLVVRADDGVQLLSRSVGAAAHACLPGATYRVGLTVADAVTIVGGSTSYGAVLDPAPGDHADHYRVLAGTERLVLTFRATSGTVIGSIYDDAGRRLSQAISTGGVPVALTASGEAYYRLGFEPSYGPATYAFTADLREL
ncbi:MAG TPA: hypothetical protein VHH36_01630 [Candidatus Thermoplasmatota archaeon]|nr:hypothetical protein [Candidatus Thermoplasmatota archaeon]